MELLWNVPGHSIALNYQCSLDICQTDWACLGQPGDFFILFICNHSYPVPARFLCSDERIVTYLVLPFAYLSQDV